MKGSPYGGRIPYFENIDDAAFDGDALGAALAEAPEFDIACCNWPDSYPYTPHCTVRMAHGRRFLCCLFTTDCRRIAARTTADLGPVAADSCVEFFLQPDGSDEYWNFEFNIIGRLNASHRRTRPNAVRLSSTELGSVARHSNYGTDAFDERDADGPWRLAAAIPLGLMADGTVLPRAFRGNIYACASSLTVPYYLSHAPIATPEPDFHRPEFFVPFNLEP